MGNLITTILEVALSVVLLGGAPFIYKYGPSGLLILGYSTYSVERRQFLWEMFPPDRWNMGASGQQGLAIVMAVIGMVAMAGFFGTHSDRNSRLGLVAATVVPILFTVLIYFQFSQVMDYRP
jgi:hypothetical protein